jgi:dethiobiotin synthetase
LRRDFFVTGTDTGVGKTLVSSALLRALRQRGRSVAGMKPLASGSDPAPEGLRNEDALALQAESSRRWPYEVVNPYAFAPPIAPHLAAAEAGVEVRLERILSCFRELRDGSETVVVEGAGGFLVPLGPGRSFADLPRAMGLEVVLVVGLRLGCLNHAFLTAEAIAHRGLKLAGWAGSLVDPGFERLPENLASLRMGLSAPCLGVIPHLAPLDLDRAVAALDGIAALEPPSTG